MKPRCFPHFLSLTRPTPPAGQYNSCSSIKITRNNTNSLQAPLSFQMRQQSNAMFMLNKGQRLQVLFILYQTEATPSIWRTELVFSLLKIWNIVLATLFTILDVQYNRQIGLLCRNTCITNSRVNLRVTRTPTSHRHLRRFRGLSLPKIFFWTYKRRCSA